MTQPENPLTAAYGRGRERDWVQQKQMNHRQRRRRGLAVGSLIAGVTFVVVFIVYDYPRESGLTDALGMTCGEYVHVGDPHEAPDPFEQWAEHQQTLRADASLDLEDFLSAVEHISEQVEAEPVLGHFRGRSITQRAQSEAVVGGQLLIGHHEEFWTGTDRVSVYTPAAEAITWTAETIHPVRDHGLADESRQRVLYGVGTTESHVVLQTPTYRGDTDLVVTSIGESDDRECVRLPGGVDSEEALSAHDRDITAWPQVMDLNAGRVGDDEFLIHHGHREDSPDHEFSTVNIRTGAADPAEPPIEPGPPEGAVELPPEVKQLSDEGFEDLEPVGEGHYLLTWDGGSIILQRR